MRLFVYLVDPAGRGISERTRRAYEILPHERGLDIRWQLFSRTAILTAWDDLRGEPIIATDGTHMAAGMVRLDNRDAIERGLEWRGEHASDLELVLRAIALHGAKYIPDLLGDFAFVVWDSARRKGVAACDAFAVKKLYYARRGHLYAFASRAEALALDDEYEAELLAEWVAGCAPSPDLTVYANVKPVPAGSMALLDGERLTVGRYWSPADIGPAGGNPITGREAADTMRQLLSDAVRLRVSGGTDTWAQLSGGTDSSAVVSLVQSLAHRGEVSHGLAGTVTYVDRQGTGADEREYSDLVARHWGIRNETIVDPPLWLDGDAPPPRIDQPRPDSMFYPREHRLCAIVTGAGGRVLLTGQGSDELLRGNMFFFADWLTRGRVSAAVREMVRRAAIGRVSFWQLAYYNAVVPLLPRRVRIWLGPEVTQLPRWVHRMAARRYSLSARRAEMALYAGPLGGKYRHAVVFSIGTVAGVIGHLLLEDVLDVRHPFLYRPLVEFGLRLPPEVCVVPYARKWVLREAMRGILPERVRTRVGKGTLDERHAWSLVAQRSILEPLLREPILADLGVVDARALRAAFEAAQRQPGGPTSPQASVQGVLAIEAWLQMRSGRWPCEGRHEGSRSTEQVHHRSLA